MIIMTPRAREHTSDFEQGGNHGQGYMGIVIGRIPDRPPHEKEKEPD